MIKIFKYLKPKEWLMAAVGLAFIVAQVWLELRVPEYMSEITTLTQTPGSEMRDIWMNGGYMILCTLGALAVTVLVSFIAAHVGASLSQRLRSLMFNKVEAFSMEEINRFSTSSLITRSTNDITHIQTLIIMGLTVTLKAPIMGVWATAKIAGEAFEWTMVTAASIVFMLILVVLLFLFAGPKFRRMQTLVDSITRVTRENLTGVRVVRAYNAEGYQEDKFENANREITGTQLSTSRAMAVMMPMASLMLGGMSLAIYWIGAYLIDAAGAMDRLVLFSNMVVFMQYSLQVILSFTMLVTVFFMLPRASVAARRINEVLGTEPSIASGKVTEAPPMRKGEIEFKNVSFKYPDAGEDAHYVLENVSFKASHGETVAFIGSTGSGKSTLLRLVSRFYDATEGEVIVSGVNVKEFDMESLLSKIGYVPQKSVLFKGTVMSNVAFGDDFEPPYDDDVCNQVRQAVKIAQGSDFVEQMEGKYDAEISQGGTNLSGGQKQRLSIARAVCRKPDIYIFDDSFSALDYRTDRTLRSELKKETAGVTSLIVAQRIGTIMDADQIIVLDEGKVVGKGTHRELLKNCEVYREIAASQLSEEELEVPA